MTSAQPRSGFITAMAWIFIILGAFSTLIAALQAVMFSVFFPIEELRASIGEHARQLPRWVLVIIDYFVPLVVALLVTSIVTLVSAIGLLRRANWARIVFIGVMAVGVAWNLAGVAMPFFWDVSSILEQAPQEFRDQFGLMWKLASVFNILVSLAIAGVFVWIIRRLLSEEIRREFA